MHKIIAGTFSALLSLIHLGAVTVFGLFLVAAYAGEIHIDPVTMIGILIGGPVSYILFAGVTSILIRISQNLERIARKLDDWPHHEVFFVDDGPLPQPGPKPSGAAPRGRSEPPVRREPQLKANPE